MKKIFSFIFLLISIAGVSQSKLYIRGDTVQIERSGGNAELILLNSGRAKTNSFLKNTGNGRTTFAYAVDSVYKANDSSLVVRRGDGLDTLIVGAGILDTTTIYKTFENPINAGQRVQMIQAHNDTFIAASGQSIINLKNGNLLMIFDMASTAIDLEPATTKTYRKISTDDGVTWGDTVAVIPAGFGDPGGAGGGSLYRSTNTDTIYNLFWKINDNINDLYRMHSIDEGITWSTPALKHTVTQYNAPSFDRVLKASNGTLWMPYNNHIAGALTSQSGRWDGKLLKSTNDGYTFTEGGVTFTAPAGDTLCVENGIAQVEDTLYHYCRCRAGDIVMWKSTNGLTGTTWSAAFYSGLKAPNSMSRIMYDQANKLWIGIHNEVYQGDISNGVNARYKLAISTVYRDVGAYAHWQNVYSVDVQRGYHFSGPSAFRWKDKLIIGYDARQFLGGSSFTYDLRQKIVPLENLLPSRNNFHDRVFIEGRPEALQDSLGGGYLQMRLFKVGVASVKDGWYAIYNNNGHQTGAGFAPEINILTGGGSEYGVVTNVETPSLSVGSFPYFTTYFTKNGVAPPVTGTYATLRKDVVGDAATGTAAFTLLANGQVLLRNRAAGNDAFSMGISSSDGSAFIDTRSNASFYLYGYNGEGITIKNTGVINFPHNAGTGTRVASLTSTGDLGAITNGTNDQVLTLVGGVPAWADATGGGGGITALTGDVTASGSGSVVATIANASVQIDDLDATGTASATTYLRGDGSWSTPGGISGLTATRVPFALNSTTLTDDADLLFDGSTLSTTHLLASGHVQGLDLDISDGTHFNDPSIAFSVNTDTRTYIFAMFDNGNSRMLLTRTGNLTVNTGNLLVTLGSITAGTIANETTDVDKFLVAGAGGLFKYRTGTELLSDIGASATGHVHAASDITSATMATARLGSGTANSTSYLRGDQTWQLLSDIATKGTYTPTITGVDNVESSTGYDLNWTRIGDMVTVFGQVEINVTAAATITRFRMSLHSASSFANTTVGGGVISSPHGVSGSVKPNAASGELLFEFLCGTDVDNRVFHFTASYKMTPP